MSYTLIINHTSMINVGGIEKYLFQLVKYLRDNNHRVIWLCDRPPRVAKSFESVFLNSNVERYDVCTHGMIWYRVPQIKFSEDEIVVMMSFEPIEMAQAELFCHKYKSYHIFPLYFVPDTTGSQYYLERNFRGTIKGIVWKKLQVILERWEQENAIRFFSITQVKPLEENYEIHILDVSKKILKPVLAVGKLDYELVKRKAENRNRFILITVGRFDFPHKGYMLGLVRAYGRLKKIYKGLELRIVGFGKDEAVLKAEIEKLDDKQSADIKLLGEASPDEISNYMKEAHLNISVAGAVGDGARNGVLSIPARNYCIGECEVYGYLPDSRLKSTSLEKGILVDDFIEEVILMSNEEYIQKCIDS